MALVCGHCSTILMEYIRTYVCVQQVNMCVVCARLLSVLYVRGHHVCVAMAAVDVSKTART